MRRRDFIKSIGGAAASWPLAARAQQSAVPVVGWLNSESPDSDIVIDGSVQAGNDYEGLAPEDEAISRRICDNARKFFEGRPAEASRDGDTRYQGVVGRYPARSHFRRPAPLIYPRRMILLAVRPPGHLEAATA